MVSQQAKELVDNFESTVGGEPVGWLEAKETLLDYIEKLENRSQESVK